MWRLAIIFFLVFCPAIVPAKDDFFVRLEGLVERNMKQALIDSVNAMPYEVMVSNLDLAAEWCERSLRFIEESGDVKTKAKLLAKLGTILYLKGNYELSTSYNLTAIHLFDSLKMLSDKGATLCELGYQMKRRNLDEAFRYFRQGLLLLETNGTKSQLATVYDNYGVLYEFKMQLDSAGFFYKKSLELKESLADSVGIPYSLNNLGLIKMMSKDYEGAKEMFQKAYVIRQSRADMFGIAENKSYFGDLYKEWQLCDSAIVWYSSSNVDCIALSYPRLRQHNLDMLVECFELIGDYREALNAARLSDSLEDVLLNEVNSKTMLELEQKFNASEKDKDIAILKSDTAAKRLVILIILIVLILMLSGAAILHVNTKRRAAAAKNAAIIAEREQGLKAVFDATEKERQRIAKDLHDGIGQQLSGLRMSWEGLENGISARLPTETNKLRSLTGILDEACAEVRTISHQMMPKVLTERGLLSAIEELLTKSLGINSIHYQLEHINVVDKRFDERIELSLYRIAQELINNIIKHSKAKEVIVQFYQRGEKLVLIIEDNGIGFSTDSKKDGIGLLNISSRLSTIHGLITWEPGPERGTVAIIRVPIKS